jgi:hypothetical protein
MRLIAIKNLRNEANRYPDAKKAIETWYLIVKSADWCSLEVRIQVEERGMREGIAKSQEWAEIASRKKAIAERA